jgi:pimeloyl-ACP methyl ester carboxylesterase
MQNIILLHGALGSAEDLIPLAKILEKRNLLVHSFSFSGHGKTTFKSTFHVEQFTQELEEFIFEKGLNNASIFGYSMGGYVALNLALQHPNLVGKIVTLGTKFNWSIDAIERETKLLNPDQMLTKVPNFAKMLALKHGSNWRELVLKTAQMMEDIGNKQHLTIQTLKNIPHKVLIGLADKDQMVSLEESASVFKSLSNASMYMLPNTKHPIETVDCNFLGTIILNFIADE